MIRVVLTLISILLPSFLFFPLTAYSDWTLSRTVINFGDVPLGSEKSEVFVITNTGTTTLTFEFYPSLPSVISVAPLGSKTVPAGSSLTVVVKFTPNVRGSYTEEILIASTDPNMPSRRITVYGASSYPAGIDVSPRSIDFSGVKVRSSKTETLRVYNYGTSQLNVAVSVPEGSPFTVSERAFQLRPGEFKNLLVTFLPTQEGFYSSGLTITSDDRFTPKIVVSLSGYTEPDFPITFFPRLVNFGNVSVKSKNEQVIIIENSSFRTIPVNLSISNVSGEAFSLPESMPLSFNLISGERRLIPIIFSPQREGYFSATLRINAEQKIANISIIGTASESPSLSIPSQLPPPDSSTGSGGCTIAGKLERANYGDVLIMVLPSLLLLLRMFLKKVKA